MYLADFSQLGDHRFANGELIRRGAGLCVIVHGSTLDEGSKDLTQRAVAAWVPTYLIDSDDGIPRRLVAGDARLG